MLEKSTLFLSSVLDVASKEHNNLKAILKSLWSHPIKLASAFVVAPFLVFRIAQVANNPVRRWVASIGLFIAIILAYVAGTFLGTFAGALIVMSSVGLLAGVGFLIGTTFSVFFSFIFAIVVLNSVSFFFLKVNTQEVIDYLDEISNE